MGSRKRPTTNEFKKKRVNKKQKVMTTMTKPELKAYDIQENFSDFVNTGTFEILNVPKKGDDRYERNGRNIRMKSLHIRGKIAPEDALASDITAEFLRYLVIYDKQSNGAPPAMGDVLRDSTSSAQSNVFSDINLDNRDRFEILRDVSFPTSYFALGTQEIIPLDPTKQCFNVDIFIPLKGKEVMFNSNNSETSADIQTGALFIMCMNLQTANNGKWTMQYQSRLRYYDV